jgi:hypothetical protein
MLNNKKVLLFVPNGKGVYGSAMSEQLEKCGAYVDVYDERPSASTSSKIITRLGKKQLAHVFKKYIKKIILFNIEKSYDYVLVIRGECFNEATMKLLRTSFPSAYFILYLWDSLKNTDTRPAFPFFDKILSFDKEDVENNKELIHRPLFFIPSYRNYGNCSQYEYDLMFIGKVHSDRFSFIKKIQKEIADKGLRAFFYFYFPSRLLYLQKRFFDNSFKNTSLKDFEFKMIKAVNIANYMSKSKCSLDMQHPLQTGLTMRTIEVLGAKRKLITTNPVIKTYDFYNENNIMVVDRKTPAIDLSFINSPYQEVDKNIYEYYSIEGWVETIFKS